MTARHEEDRAGTTEVHGQAQPWPRHRCAWSWGPAPPIAQAGAEGPEPRRARGQGCRWEHQEEVVKAIKVY